jgi:hypothetical protein
VAAPGADPVAIGVARPHREPVVVDTESPVALGAVAVGLASPLIPHAEEVLAVWHGVVVALPVPADALALAPIHVLQRPAPIDAATCPHGLRRQVTGASAVDLELETDRPPLAPKSFDGLASSTRSRSESAALEFGAMMPRSSSLSGFAQDFVSKR